MFQLTEVLKVRVVTGFMGKYKVFQRSKRPIGQLSASF